MRIKGKGIIFILLSSSFVTLALNYIYFFLLSIKFNIFVTFILQIFLILFNFKFHIAQV